MVIPASIFMILFMGLLRAPDRDGVGAAALNLHKQPIGLGGFLSPRCSMDKPTSQIHQNQGGPTLAPNI
jgi:hypothetical protein